MTTLNSLHESDFCLWATKSAELIKAGKFNELDIEHLVEEVESMGASEKRALESRLIELMQHLLKWQFQPKRRGSSWEISINKQRVGIEKILQDNPSLKSITLMSESLAVINMHGVMRLSKPNYR